MATNFQKLIERYANGKQVCNCGNAYYTNCGKGYSSGEYREDMPTCKHGCSANEVEAREYIATMVLKELGNKEVIKDG